MFIWQYINLPVDEVRKIQYEFNQAMPDNDLFFQNLNIDTKHVLSLPLKEVVLIQVPPWGGIDNEGIHTDAGDTKLAINIPLYNCEDSITSFWESSISPELYKTKNNHEYAYYKADNCKKIAEFKLIDPVIFEVKIPHTVTNPTNKWRRAISLRFIKDPWHLIKSNISNTA